MAAGVEFVCGVSCSQLSSRTCFNIARCAANRMRKARMGLGPSLTMQSSGFPGGIPGRHWLSRTHFWKSEIAQWPERIPVDALASSGRSHGRDPPIPIHFERRRAQNWREFPQKCDYGNFGAQDGLERDCVVHHAVSRFQPLARRPACRPEKPGLSATLFSPDCRCQETETR